MLNHKVLSDNSASIFQYLYSIKYCIINLCNRIHNYTLGKRNCCHILIFQMATRQDLGLERNDLVMSETNAPLSPASDDPVEVKLSYKQVGKREVLLQWETNCLIKDTQFELSQVEKITRIIVYVGNELEYKLFYESKSLGTQFCYKVTLKGENVNCESNVLYIDVPPEIPSQPLAPKIQVSSKTTATIRWNAVEKNGSFIKAYHLERSQEGSGNFELVYSGIERNIKLPFKLETAKSYKFRLRAENEVGFSQYSPILNFSSSPGKPTPPSPPYVKSHTSSSISVGWDEVASQQEDTSYILAMEDPSTGHGFIIIHNDKEAEFTKKGLHRITSYNFRLAVCNQFGTSPYSTVVTFTTAADVPKQPHSLTLQSKPEYRSLCVAWLAHKDDGGDTVKIYSVEVAPLGKHYKRPYNIACEENEVKLQDLRPGKEYQIRVAAQNSAGLGLYSDPVIFTTKIQKPEPPRLGVDGIKAGLETLRLEWDYPSFDGGSKIMNYQLDMLHNHEWVTIYENRFKNYTVKNLEPLTSYTFRVRCQNEAGYGQFTKSFEGTTIVGPPSAPLPPVLTSSHLLSINVSWTPPPLQGVPVTGYSVQMQAFGGSSKWRSVYEGANLACVVKQNILPSTKYQFRISAKSSMGNSLWSEFASISTDSGPPGVVQDVRMSKIKSTSALVEWSPVELEQHPTQSYLIILNHTKHTEVHHPNSSYNITSLQPYTDYNLKIQARNRVGIGPLSQVLTFKTSPLPPMPPTLELSSLTSSSVFAKWSPDSALTDRYLLQVRLAESDNGDFQAVYAGNEKRFKLVRLKPRTGYVIRICAANSSGEGSFSEGVSFYTLPQSPPTPRDLKAEWAGDKLLISWKDQIYDTYTYLLQFRELGKEFHTIHEGNACKCILNCSMINFDIRVITKLNFTNKLDHNWPDSIESNPCGVLTVVKPKQEQVKAVKKSEKYYEKKVKVKEPIVEEMPPLKQTRQLPPWISQTINNPYIWIGIMLVFTLLLSLVLPYFVRFN